MEKIKSITEAFAQQPITLQVGGLSSNSIKIESISLEIVELKKMGDPFEEWYYIGRDINGNKLFQYRAETVNVHYY